MKRFILIGIGTLLILAGIFFIVRFVVVGTRGKGALQTTSNIKSSVYLNGKLIGTTPLCKCKDEETIREGEYNLMIEPEDPSFESFSTKIKIGKDVLTAVDRTFLPGSLASASVLTLEKIPTTTPQLFILSIPEGAIVTIDGNAEGLTPFSLNDITASEHEVEIQKNGFNKKTLRIRTVPSYKLLAQVILGTEAEAKKIEDNEASPSARLSPTKSPFKGTIVRIKNTPTGFLRVREGPSTSEKEIAKVNPEEEFKYLDEDAGWFKIQLKDGEFGWVSSTYSEKITL